MAVRFQRGVLQRWTTATPWAAAGSITLVNAGELYQAIGRVPGEALVASAVEPLERPLPDLVEGETTPVAWSGWWWPALDGANGPHLFDADGPLDKYDRLAEHFTGERPGTRAWELEHLRFFDARYSWAGHCNGFAAAAVLEPEPTEPIDVAGVRLSVADQKGLLAAYHFADAARWSVAEPGGIAADAFHRTVVTWLVGAGKPFIANVYFQPEQIFNYPAYRYRIEFRPDRADPPLTHVRTTLWFADYNVPADYVGTKPWPGPAGKLYEYWIRGDRKNPVAGGWEGVSTSGAFARPSLLWYPDPTIRNAGQELVSPELRYEVIERILDRD